MKSSQWQEIIKKWENSGQTQKKFCKDKGIRFNDFKRWRSQGIASGLFNKISGSSCKNHSFKQAFSELKLIDDDNNNVVSHKSQTAKHLEICLPCGIILKLPV